MKKMMTVMMMILVAAACCLAGAHTHTITLISRVEKQKPEYAIRNHETGETGASVLYITDEIAKQDVGTSFDILQVCHSNCFSEVKFTVSATELIAKVDGKVYSTKGVDIVKDGVSYGSRIEFTETTVGLVEEGTVVASFAVNWPTDSNLVQASYTACITLETTAL
ncbi:MAG: hypothetical protein IKT95_03435 [Spirochaetales bacterium]|nr:hypothetical protein [Spirochaetales bacterium]